MSQISIFAEVSAERRRQDAKWGGPEHDDEHTPDDWEQFIMTRCALESDSDPTFRQRMVEVAALAVAAIESHDRKKSP